MAKSPNEVSLNISLTRKGKKALQNNELTGDMKAVFEQLVALDDEPRSKTRLEKSNGKIRR